LYDETTTTWQGDLNEVDNTRCYFLYNQDGIPDLLNVLGAEADPADYPITLSSGSNYIGYPSTEILSLNAAFANLNAQHSDLIKNQSQFAIYDDVLGWLGSLKQLTPGEGYVYLSGDAADKTFTYATGSPSAKSAKPSVKERVPQRWFKQRRQHKHHMPLVAQVVDVEDAEAGVLAAFVGKELRGWSEYLRFKGQDLHLTSISGDSTELLRFEFITPNKRYPVLEELAFDSIQTQGSLEVPVELHLGQPTALGHGRHAHALASLASIVEESPTTTEVETIQMPEVTLYPNPATGMVTLANLSPQGATLRMYNLKGKLVLAVDQVTASTVQLDISGLPAGLYLVNIYQNGELQSKKLSISDQ